MTDWKIHRWPAKIWTILGPGVVGSTGWWWMTSYLIHGQARLQDNALWLVLAFAATTLLSLALWLGPLYVLAHIEKHQPMLLAGSVMLTIPLFGFYPLAPWTFAVAGLMMLALWWGSEAVRREAMNRRRIQPHQTILPSLGPAIFVLALSVSLLYYQQLARTASTPTVLGQNIISQTVSITERFLPKLFPQYQPSGRVDEFLGGQIPSADRLLADIRFETLTSLSEQQELVRQRLSVLGVAADQREIAQAETVEELGQVLNDHLTQYRSEIIDQSRQELSQGLDVPIQNEDTMHDVLVNVLSRQYQRYVAQYVQYIPPLLALALFFAIRLFTGWLLITVAIGSSAYYHLLKRFGVIKTVKKSLIGERLVWS